MSHAICFFLKLFSIQTVTTIAFMDVTGGFPVYWNLFPCKHEGTEDYYV